jgi:hypothetical protein
MSVTLTLAKNIRETCRGAAKSAFPGVYQFLSPYRLRQHCKKRHGKFQDQLRPLLYGINALARLSRLNHVSNLRFHSLCTFEELEKLPGPTMGTGLLFCDIRRASRGYLIMHPRQD